MFKDKHKNITNYMQQPNKTRDYESILDCIGAIILAAGIALPFLIYFAIYLPY
jgi:hypothetical protein